jgi:putative FmdB family regulatory protein
MAATVPLGIVPTYQYECTECGEALEVHQSFSDDPLTTCPSCSGRLRKVYNAVGVVFKGSGFYRTDSRKPESGESTSKPAEKKADKKPEKKKEASKASASD